MNTIKYMADIVDKEDSVWYLNWCERDGTEKELYNKYSKIVKINKGE